MVRGSLLKLLPQIEDFDKLAHECGYNSHVMAFKLGVSTRTLQRYADDRFGQPLHAYLRKLRMDRALVMVEKNPENFKAIAIELGFKQYTHFCREFKETHGLSPAHWMENSEQIIPPICKKLKPLIRQRLRSLRHG